MIECLSVPIKSISENDHDVFKASPFLRKRFKQLIEDGFFLDPLVVRRIKTFGPEQLYKNAEANYKLRELKKLGFKEVTVLAHDIMTEQQASELTLHLASKTEIIKKEKISTSMADVTKGYTETELQKRMGLDDLVPAQTEFDISPYELSEEEIKNLELSIKIEIPLGSIGIECRRCGCLN